MVKLVRCAGMHLRREGAAANNAMPRCEQAMLCLQVFDEAVE